MPTRTTRKLTQADYEQIPPDRDRHEISAGEEFVTPAPDVSHQRSSRKLEFILEGHVTRHQLGEVFYAPIDVVLSDENIVQPDILFVSAARSAIVGEKNIQGAPDLVVEILPPSTAARDRGAKRELYLRFGVLEYWIVDHAARLVEVHVFGSAPRQQAHADGQSFESALLPGLRINVSEIL